MKVREEKSGGHLSRTLELKDEIAREEAFEKLAVLAKEAGLPTIGEYYRQVSEDPDSIGSLDKAAYEMVSEWTCEWPTAGELLARLKDDALHRMYLTKHYKIRCYYTVTQGERKEFFRTKSTETLLNLFILQAEEAGKKGQKIRFSYCLRENLPEGIDLNGRLLNLSVNTC